MFADLRVILNNCLQRGSDSVWWLELLGWLLLIASCYFSIRLLLYVHHNFRAYFGSEKKRFARAAKPLATLFVESVVYAGSAVVLLFFVSLFDEPWEQVLSNIPFGMFVASILVWLTLPVVWTKAYRRNRQDK